MKSRLFWVVLMGGVLAAGPAWAGARILCDVIPIGQAASLPWDGSRGWNGPREDYQSGRLVPDTLRLLTPQTPVLVRMETLRRATLYARKFSGTSAGQASVGRELAGRLMARALDAEAAGKGEATAWFDAGYFLESLEHWDEEFARQADGERWVHRALALRGADPEMELAAMILARESPKRPGRHYPRALAGSKQNPELARTLMALFPATAD